MNQKVVNEILDELISAFEAIETQSAGILMYLKAQEIVTDAQLKPYLEVAGNASSGRWRAARARIEHLLSAALKDAPPPDKTKPEPNSASVGELNNNQEKGPAAQKTEKASERTENPDSAYDRDRTHAQFRRCKTTSQ